jgi:hypothetical protein
MTSASRLPEYFRRKFIAAFEGQTPNAQQLEAFEEMSDALELAETDATYFKDILEGIWPQSEEILELKLKEVKAKNGKNLPIPQKPTNSFVKVGSAECW